MIHLVWALVVCAVLTQIAYPLTTGTTRDMVTVAVVVLLAAAVLVHAVLARGALWALVLLGATAGLGIAIELLGTATSVPFGSYFYATDRLGPDILGVPAIVPLAWTAGFYPVWCAVSYLIERSRVPPDRHAVSRIALAAIGMVGWDMYLDTQMVTDGQWTWTSGIPGLPGIPSIPYTNYLGWILTAVLMAAIMEYVGRRVDMSSTADRRISDAAPLALFLWTWLGSALAHAVFLEGDELRYAAIYGFCVMGVVGIPLVATWLRQRRKVPVQA
jgi:uncharacterized membrane protein